MSELLTTKQLTEILQVDRTTIYRMADQGRIPGIKVGNQWRFPRNQIEAWLQSHGFAFGQALAETPSNGDFAMADDLALELFLPLECIQLTLDGFAKLLGVMSLITDLQGHAVSRPSNPCGYFLAAEQSPNAHKRCMQHWAKLAQVPSLMPRFQPSHLGLLCARGFIRAGNEIKGMLILGGIAPELWPPDAQEVQTIAEDLGMEPSMIAQHVHEVHHLTLEQQQATLPYVQRIADIVSYIATDRLKNKQRLQKIIEIAQQE